MPCNTTLKPNQTVAQRITEIHEATQRIDKLLTNKRVQVRVGPQGAVAFTGISAIDRDGMTDACIYYMLTRTGSAAAKMAIARAEQLAGRSVDRAVVAHGTHSHDGGATWHPRG